MSGVQQLAVRAAEAGLRIDKWFKRRYPDLTHGRLQKLARSGQIRLDGKRVKSGDRVEEGQIVRVPPLGDAQTFRAKPPPAPKDPNVRALERELTEALGLSVNLAATGRKGGKLTLAYTDLEQLDLLVQRLTGRPQRPGAGVEDDPLTLVES